VGGCGVGFGIWPMRDLCVLGWFPGVQPSAFLGLGKVGWVGFFVNAVSGFALFASQATVFVTSVPFLIKIACIVAGMVLAGVIQSRLRAELSLGDSLAVVSNSTRTIALVSLMFWLAAIIAGRLIAYIF